MSEECPWGDSGFFKSPREETGKEWEKRCLKEMKKVSERLKKESEN